MDCLCKDPLTVFDTSFLVLPEPPLLLQGTHRSRWRKPLSLFSVVLLWPFWEVRVPLSDRSTLTPSRVSIPSPLSTATSLDGWGCWNTPWSRGLVDRRRRMGKDNNDLPCRFRVQRPVSTRSLSSPLQSSDGGGRRVPWGERGLCVEKTYLKDNGRRLTQSKVPRIPVERGTHRVPVTPVSLKFFSQDQVMGVLSDTQHRRGGSLDFRDS